MYIFHKTKHTFCGSFPKLCREAKFHLPNEQNMAMM